MKKIRPNTIYSFFLLCSLLGLSSCSLVFDLGVIKTKNSLGLRNLITESTVYGSSHDLNYYYANLYLGDPPQKQAYILDTGSSITTSPCKPYCEKCGKHLNSYYTVKKPASTLPCEAKECSMVTSTCSNSNCSFSISYSEGSSLKGVYIKELVRFGDDYRNDKGNFLPIGCTISENNLFYTQLADGIMGLSNSDRAFPTMLFKEGIITENIFSLCLSTKGGYFSLGEINKKFHKEDTIKYIKVNSSGFYNVKLKSITISSKVFTYENKGGIIDSGTTISYFPTAIADNIINTFKEHCKTVESEKNISCGKLSIQSDVGPCFEFKSNEAMKNAIENAWPSVEFLLEDNLNFVWEPKHYFFNYTEEDSPKKYMGCLGFASSSSQRITFGSTWMHGHDIIFDRSASRIGFVAADCDRGNPENSGVEERGEEKNDDDKEDEECIETNESTMKTYIIFYSIVCFALIGVIIYMSFAIFYLKRGKNFCCIKMSPGLGYTKNIDVDVEKGSSIETEKGTSNIEEKKVSAILPV